MAIMFRSILLISRYLFVKSKALLRKRSVIDSVKFNKSKQTNKKETAAETRTVSYIQSMMTFK